MGWVAVGAAWVVDMLIVAAHIVAVIAIEAVGMAITFTCLIAHSLALIVVAIVQTSFYLITLNLSAIATTWVTTYASLGLLWTGVVADLAIGAQAIHLSFKALLEVVHFDTISKINRILMFVSSDYRELVYGFNEKVSEISNALNLGENTLNLLLRQMEGHQQQFSALIGRSYEIGKLDFIKTMQNWQGWEAIIERKGSVKYADIVDWLDSVGPTNVGKSKFEEAFNEQYEKIGPILAVLEGHGVYNVKQLNLGMAFDIFQGLSDWRKVEIGCLDSAVNAIDATIKNVIRIEDTLNAFTKALPKNWQDDVINLVGPSIADINSKILDEYEPAIKELQKYVNIQRDNNLFNDRALDNIADKIKRPGTLLESVDFLDMIERRIEENKIAEVSNRSYEYEAEIVSNEEQRRNEIIHTQFMDVKPSTPAPEWQRSEKEGIQYPPGEEPPKGKTWYVGDY